MKNYIKLYALLAMALFVGACDDELNIGENNTNATPTTIVPGGDIFFGASAKKKSAGKKDKRTVYGDSFDSDNDNQKDKIELNWVANDRVQIASPQSGGVANGVAEYSVATIATSEDGDSSSIATLQLESKAGLQWNDVTPGAQYNFYAVYPSVEQLSKSIPASEKAKCKLTADGKLTGYLPNTQTVTLDTDKSKGNNYVFKPNMDYAYMIAAEEYFIPELNSNGEPLNEDQDVTIDLNFSSMVTALKFTINAGEISIGAENAAGGKTEEITVTDLTLFSASGEVLCGAFECNFSTFDFKTNNDHTGFNQVTMNLGNEGCKLSSKNGSITTTFFMLPVNGVNGGYTKGDLKLIIHYYVNDVPQTMTATLGVDIPVSEMTYIKNLTMKDLKTEVISSSWFQALNPNIYVSQVSIPVAANTFANSSYKITDTYRTQQTKTIEQMWNMGVRGFEMVNTSDGKTIDTDATALGNMVASEAKQDAAGTFIDNVKLLRSKQVQSFTYDNNGKFISGDPLILICTYSATNDGYNPARYVRQLLHSLESLTGASNQTYNGIELKIDANTFVQFTSNSTVKDVMGKICVIIRPGNDERWATETGEQYDPYGLYKTYSNITPESIGNSKYGLTKALPKLIESGSAWWSRVVLISDWGQDSWDSWHRRFGLAGFYYYATTGTNYDKLGTNKRKCTDKMEQYIIGEKTMPSNAPTAREYYYPHDLVLGNNTTTAHVQDMVRIAYGDFQESKSSYTVKWPSSIDEKKMAIDGLFEKSVATKGSTTTNDIYINNLSGYFITSNHAVSWYPAYLKKRWGGEIFPGNSKGGDYKTCAKTLTDHVYNLLSGKSNTTTTNKTLNTGPWGLVMMDYIGSDGNENSQKLVYLIMMNNFRFPLSQKHTTE